MEEQCVGHVDVCAGSAPGIAISVVGATMPGRAHPCRRVGRGEDGRHALVAHRLPPLVARPRERTSAGVYPEPEAEPEYEPAYWLRLRVDERSGLRAHRTSSLMVSSKGRQCLSSSVLIEGPEGETLRRRRASSEGSRGVTGMLLGLHEREMVRFRWTHGRGAQLRSHDGTGSDWMTIAESCVLLLSSDELPEVEHRTALGITDRLGCVGIGWNACEGEVARRGW